MNDISTDKRIEYYGEFHKEVMIRERANADNYDKAILALSTAGLGFSTSLKSILVEPTEEVIFLGLIYTSWILFGIAIFSTILSFLISQQALKNSLKYAEKYYIENQGEYLNKVSCYAKTVEIIRYLSGLLFLAAIVMIILFTFKNI